MLLQRMRLVLREHENAAQSGMEAVAERESDDAISSPEGHGRLGPLGSQGMQTRTDSARQDDADRLLVHEGLRSRTGKSTIGGFDAGFKSFPEGGDRAAARSRCVCRNAG